MSIWRSTGRKGRVAFHANALLGYACFMTYDDQAAQMAFSFHSMQLRSPDVRKTETGNCILLMETL